MSHLNLIKAPVDGGKQAAVVSAELVGVKSSRVDSDFRTTTFKPNWLDSIGRQQTKLSLKSPNLVDSSIIIVTAYAVKRLFHKRLVSNGLLGDSSDICPLPSNEAFTAVEKSHWSDKSPHEISSVAVERGVRVEVLDWRASNDSDKPTLVLLHGGGATALQLTCHNEGEEGPITSVALEQGQEITYLEYLKHRRILSEAMGSVA